MDEDEDEDAAAGESAFDKVSEVFVSEGEADVILSHKRLFVTIYRYVSKDAQGSSLLFNVLFLSITDYFQLYSTILQLNNLPKPFRKTAHMLSAIQNAAKNSQPLQTKGTVQFISASSALTHLDEQVSKVETIAPFSAEEIVDVRILRNFLASFAATSTDRGSVESNGMSLAGHALPSLL
jgi:hypothetical protein